MPAYKSKEEQRIRIGQIAERKWAEKDARQAKEEQNVERKDRFS